MNSVTSSSISKKLVKMDSVEGLYVARHFIRTDTVRDVVHNLQLASGDLLFAGYLKSGSTWTQYIIWHIFNEDVPSPSLYHMNHNDFPYMEMVGLDVLKDRPHPWLMKMHLPYTHVPKHPEAKYIYVARNPKDMCVSYFPFLRQRTKCIPDGMSFEEFFDCFVEGEVPYNDPFSHILSWYEHKDDPNVLFLKYEEMRQDPVKAVLDIAHFISPNHREKLLKNSVKRLEHILESTSFETMKTIPTYAVPNKDVSDASSWVGVCDPTGDDVKNNPQRFGKVEICRKGIIGDWKNHFTDDMNDRMEAIMERKLKSTAPDLYQLWSQN